MIDFLEAKRYYHFNWKVLCGQWSKGHGWFRFGRKGFGLCVKNTEPLFSERYGYIRTLKLGFGWRLQFISRIKE